MALADSANGAVEDGDGEGGRLSSGLPIFWRRVKEITMAMRRCRS